MCGHVGFATTNKLIQTENEKFLGQGLYVDALRGRDSTGILCVNYKDPTDYSIYKKALQASDFLQLKKTRELLAGAADCSLVIGHNRSATRGSIRDCTSHPYEHGDIILAHNGTLSQVTGMEGVFPTDSEEITYTINKNGEKDTLPKIRGAYALVWWNKKDNTINFARNKEREFHYSIAEDGKTVYWASEAAMLNLLLLRNNIKTKGIAELPVGMHFKWSLEQGESMEACIQHEFDVYVPVQVTTSYPYKTSHHEVSKELTKSGISKGSYVTFLITDVTYYSSKYHNEKDTTCTITGMPVGIDGITKKMTVSAWSIPAKQGKRIERIDKKEPNVFQGKVKDMYSVIHGNEEIYRVTIEPTIDYVCSASEWEELNETKSTDYVGPKGLLYTKTDFSKLIYDGCSKCTMPLDVEDEESIVWHGNYPVCANCVGAN